MSDGFQAFLRGLFKHHVVGRNIPGRLDLTLLKQSLLNHVHRRDGQNAMATARASTGAGKNNTRMPKALLKRAEFCSTSGGALESKKAQARFFCAWLWRVEELYEDANGDVYEPSF